MLSDRPTVFIANDDLRMRDSVRLLLQSQGIRTEHFRSARALLDARAMDRPGCLVLDHHLADMSGLKLQEELFHQGCTMPTIMIAGRVDASVAIKAMKLGVVDFFQKPFANAEFLRSIKRALSLDASLRAERFRMVDLAHRLSELSDRERGILDGLIHGWSNRVIAQELCVSFKTVEYYRGKLMKKLACRSLAILLQKIHEYEEYRRHYPGFDPAVEPQSV